MSARPPLPPGPYLVVGLARSGAAAARMLREHGEVIACDRDPGVEPEGLDGVEVHAGSDGVELLARARTLVKSPGVPREAAVVAAARERGLEVTGELELAWRLIPNEFVAVTGTNGKTTTVELLGAMHREGGVPVAVAGNVGTPLAALAGALDPGAVVVCEASSFQLEDSSAFAPECALLLNLSEDHLDRHGTLDDYRAAKLRIFANQGGGDVAIVPAGMATQGAARTLTFGAGGDLDLHDGSLRFRGRPFMPASELRLRGAHNLANALAAAGACLARGLSEEAVAAALRSFAGVPHRMEDVGERDGVLYVNDSKATNVEAARAAIESFPGGVHAILGGSLKGGGFAGLRDAVASRCERCYLIGEAADRLAEDLAGTVPLERCETLDRAVAAAVTRARSGDVVLLAPACASFDQYEDFEARGEHFRALVATSSPAASPQEREP